MAIAMASRNGDKAPSPYLLHLERLSVEGEWSFSNNLSESRRRCVQGFFCWIRVMSSLTQRPSFRTSEKMQCLAFRMIQLWWMCLPSLRWW
jgi:hypothetical protein